MIQGAWKFEYVVVYTDTWQKLTGVSAVCSNKTIMKFLHSNTARLSLWSISTPEMSREGVQFNHPLHCTTGDEI